MNIILVEFDSGDGVEAEAFKSKQSLIDWYINLEQGDIENRRFKAFVNSEKNRFNIDHHSFTIYYNYSVV